MCWAPQWISRRGQIHHTALYIGDADIHRAAAVGHERDLVCDIGEPLHDCAAGELRAGAAAPVGSVAPRTVRGEDLGAALPAFRSAIGC